MIRSPIRHTAACAVAVGALGVPLAASADFVICKQTFATLASASGSATSKSLPLVGQATSAEMASCVDANRPPSPDRLAGIIPEIDIPSARALHADERCDEVLIFFRKHRGSIEKWLFCVHRKIEDPHLLAVNVEQCGNDPRLVRIRTCTNPDPTTKACPKPGLWESECIDAVGARLPRTDDVISLTRTMDLPAPWVPSYVHLTAAATVNDSEPLSILVPGDPSSVRVRQSSISRAETGPFGIAVSARPWRLYREATRTESTIASARPWYVSSPGAQSDGAKARPDDPAASCVAGVLDSLDLSTATVGARRVAGGEEIVRTTLGATADLAELFAAGGARPPQGERRAFVACVEDALRQAPARGSRREGGRRVSSTIVEACRAQARAPLLLGAGVAAASDRSPPGSRSWGGIRGWFAATAASRGDGRATLLLSLSNVSQPGISARGHARFGAGLRSDIVADRRVHLAVEVGLEGKDRPYAGLIAGLSLPGGVVFSPGVRLQNAAGGSPDAGLYFGIGWAHADPAQEPVDWLEERAARASTLPERYLECLVRQPVAECAAMGAEVGPGGVAKPSDTAARQLADRCWRSPGGDQPACDTLWALAAAHCLGVSPSPACASFGSAFEGRGSLATQPWPCRVLRWETMFASTCRRR